MDFNHKTVLISETLSLLSVSKSGIYVDGTAGGGGLSREIALRNPEGKLVCIDRDPDAIEACKSRLRDLKNVEIVQGNFSEMNDIVHNLGINQVDGITLDLGVSSHQLDSAERGFSYKFDAPLDMRMSQKGKSAYDVVNFLEYKELRNIISKYGEERFASRIAKTIVEKRERKHINTTLELAEIIKQSVPNSVKRAHGHPARKTFQAIRIYVNKELEALSEGMEKALRLLKKRGILIVITFHSLEDRIVKQKMNSWVNPCQCPSEFPVCVCGKFPEVELITKKPIYPSEEEVNLNFRSRSAKLRACKKL